MPYATLAQLTDRYSQELLVSLTDRGDPATGAIVVAVVDKALADADAKIDGYLIGRYTLPLAVTPPQIPPIAQAIAFHKLHLYSRSQQVMDDFDEAMRSLREIASGVIRLPVDGVEPAGSGASEVRVNDRKRPFTPENLKGLI